MASALSIWPSFVNDCPTHGIYQILVVMQKFCRVFILNYGAGIWLQGEGHVGLGHHAAEDYPAVLKYHSRVFINDSFAGDAIRVRGLPPPRVPAALYRIGEYVGLRAQPRYRIRFLRSRIIQIIVVAAIV